ncbi:MAG: right-handed parallel beta-helix repeat-containing protein [Bacteroidales bacterium]|nr:right-handed parallel beta-helix repeat-containing protein [Bacteroidales bacterium]
MLNKNIFKTPVFIAILLIFNLACKKDKFIDDNTAKLAFSSDSVLFDTVFTTLGSATKYIKIYNNYNQKIKISSIRLAGGDKSMFSVNIDGKYTSSATDIEIAAKDSMFILLKVTVDPNNSNTPLVIKDSLVFNTNTNLQYIKLLAWGQDAHFIVYDTFIKGLPPFKIVAKEKENITWTNDKPYVIYGYAVVDSTGSLTIQEGAKIHFYSGSGLWVYKGGSLKVKGSKDKPVVFQGTRLEQFYKEIPGQWDRIWLNEGSVNNEINYAEIKNSFIGIQAETLDEFMGNELILSNTIIKNCSGAGILARFYKITAANNVIYNCGQYAVALTKGGYYDFRNCTMANFWSNSSRQSASVVLNNYFIDYNKVVNLYNLENAYFGNCIIYGGIKDEILLDKAEKADFKYKFDHCLLKTSLNTSDTLYYVNCILNSDPLFFDINKQNYQLKEKSPAIGTGSSNILTTLTLSDILGNPRNTAGSVTDLGAYVFKK